MIVTLSREHRNIALDAVRSVQSDLNRLRVVVERETGLTSLPADVEKIFKWLDDLRKFLDHAEEHAQPGELKLPAAADRILKLVLIPYRRSLMASLERSRAAIVNPEMLAQLDEKLVPLNAILEQPWFCQAARLRYPRMADFLSRDRVESITRPGQLGERQVEPKFGILLSSSLMYSDLPVLRAACDDRGTGVAVAFLDIDRFKEFNTALTEPIVDRDVLPTLMRAIERRLYGHGHAYRYGGDEIVVVIPSATQKVAIALLAEIRRDVAAVEYRATDVTATLSVGVCLAGADSPFTDRELLQKASDAKKFAKEQGRDCIATYRTTWMRSNELFVVAPSAEAEQLPGIPALEDA